METYSEAKELVDHPEFEKRRKEYLAKLTDDMIDAPLVTIINDFNKIPCCFSIQCCYGHFVHEAQPDPKSCKALPETTAIVEVEYRFAYIAFCIENSELGSRLLDSLKGLTALDPANVQICSAQWFWDRLVNTYALQVEPDRFKNRDMAVIDYEEAFYLQTLRDRFFSEFENLMKSWA